MPQASNAWSSMFADHPAWRKAFRSVLRRWAKEARTTPKSREGLLTYTRAVSRRSNLTSIESTSGTG